MTQPASVTFDGTDLVLWVPAIADPTEPTLVELQDVSVLDLSCYLTDAGWAPAMTEAGITDNRLCSRIDFSGPGRKSFTFPLAYVFNPDVPADDEARLTLAEDTVGFFVERPAIDFDVPLATGDFVWVFPVKLGRQFPGTRTANTPWTMSQMAYAVPPGPSDLVQVVAS